MADFIYLMETRLTPDQQRAVALVTDVARAHDMNIFLTGGAVRDIISGFIIRDLDFSAQGNALKTILLARMPFLRNSHRTSGRGGYP